MSLLGSISALSPTNVIAGFTFADTINSSLASYNVATEAIAGGWNGTSLLFATITQASGGEITGTADNAFDTGTLPVGSTVALTIENTAFTRGNGGTGGDGGILNLDGDAGAAGGTAINFQSNGSVTIDAGGEISGGGGGGGGGGGFLQAAPLFTEGYGGGGGGGFANGSGGSGPFDASDGSDGTSGGGGAGGAAGGSGGAGGAGGNAATAGTAGTNATGDGGAAGAAGSAIEKNGFTVTITNNGSINGDINA